MTIRMLTLTAGIAALIAGNAVAQETTAGADTAAVAEAEIANADKPPFEYKSLDQMTVGDMIGMTVRNPEGATIGDIDYVVPNMDGAEAVIGIGGFLGLGEYTVSLPLVDFSYDAEQDVLLLNTNKETLKAQPEFDETDAESLPDDMRIADLIMPIDPATGEGGTGESGQDAPESEAKSGSDS